MTHRAWMTSIVLAITAASTICRPARAQDSPPVAAPADSPQRDIDQLSAALYDPSLKQDQRDEAARRLASRQTPEARKLLYNILREVGNRGGQLAVAHSLADEPHPDPAVIDPLFALLGPDKSLTEAAAQALANFKDNPEVLTRLSNFVQDRRQPEAVRVVTARALGTLINKPAAELLMNLLTRDDESLLVRNAAADALGNMTGYREYGQDVQRWQQWWGDNRNRSEAEFRATLLSDRATRYDQLQQRYTRLTDEMQLLLSEQYQSAPEAQKADVALRYLGSQEPAIRVVGAQIVNEDALNGKVIPATVKERLRALVGDSAEKVRLEVARALGQINDAAALEPLLTQLSQETDAAVKIQIARALAPIRDLRAVPELLKLLRDPSYRVAEAAAGALRDLAPVARQNDPRLAAEVSDTLSKVIADRTTAGNVATAGLRAAALEAMGALRDPEQLRGYIPFLTPRESLPVRRAALKALGELGDKHAADAIAGALLQDPDAPVLLEAAKALETTATWSQYPALLSRLDAGAEPDASVRNQAWNVFQSLLPTADVRQLVIIVDQQFRNDPERRLVILEAICDQLNAQKKLDDLALQQENIGKTLTDLKRYADAVHYYSQALDHWGGPAGKAGVPAIVNARLTEKVIQSLLAARQYHEAAKFAGNCIADNPANQEVMGSEIRAAGELLMNQAAYSDVVRLTGEIRMMNPPLDRRYFDQLADLERQAQQRLAGQKGQRTGDTPEPPAAAGQ